MKKAFIFFTLIGVFCPLAYAQKENRYQLEYAPSKEVYVYHHYLLGQIEEKGESQAIHLQFLHKWNLSKAQENRYLLKEWGERYQGTSFDLSQLGLPCPGERVERIIDRWGRVDKVLRYPAGHRYYLNLLVFPDHPVPVGKSWEYPYKINFELFGRSIPGSCKIIYTLDKVLNYKKHFCAKILIEAKCQAGAENQPSIDMFWKGKAFFAIDEKREIDYKLKVSWIKINPEENYKEALNIELYSLLEE